MLFSLRLAHVLSRGRIDADLPVVKVSLEDDGFVVSLPKAWADDHPLTEFSLKKEASEWERIGRSYRIKLK